jgi:hypothetical protein
MWGTGKGAKNELFAARIQQNLYHQRPIKATVWLVCNALIRGCAWSADDERIPLESCTRICTLPGHWLTTNDKGQTSNRDVSALKKQRVGEAVCIIFSKDITHFITLTKRVENFISLAERVYLKAKKEESTTPMMQYS